MLLITTPADTDTAAVLFDEYRVDILMEVFIIESVCRRRNVRFEMCVHTHRCSFLKFE
jgi:hypothetical protein